MAVRKKLIRAIAEKILQDHEIRADDIPVDVERIVAQCGIELKKDDVDDSLSGFLVRNVKGGKAVIGVNKKHHQHRQRFTIAHELAHYLLHEGEVVHFDGEKPGFIVNRRDEKSSTGADDLEREANLFAAELLMPARFLERDPRLNGVDLLDTNPTLKEMAADYNVSVRALTYRLANLGLIDA